MARMADRYFQGIMYLGCPVIFYVYGKWPWARRWSSMIGLPILATSIVAASFAETVWQLILTQGVGYAIGGALLYCPLISYMNEWFVQRKGLGKTLLHPCQYTSANK